MRVVLPNALCGVSSLEEAARIVIAALPPGAPATVWVTEGDERRLLAGDGPGTETGGDGVVVTAACDLTIEVVGGSETDRAGTALLLAAVADRLDAETQAERARQQLAASERLGGLGSYDWNLADGHLVWSDELFRIYGERPGAYQPTYEGFLDRVHPDDRERVRQIHESALKAGRPFETEERILRPDGEVRTLLTNGRVVTNSQGRPVGLHGVCRDVTEEHAARERARSAASRFETLVETSPDAIVVIDSDGRIRSVNPQAERLFGYDTATLTSMSVDELVPRHARDLHARLRRGFAAEPATRSMAAGTDLQALRADGTHVAVDIALTPLEGEIDGSVAAFVRDATPRRQAEQASRRLAEAQLRRQQALELNDNVVQGLVALLWELDEADSVPTKALRHAEQTLSAARKIMSDLLTELPEDRGALVRTRELSEATPTPPATPSPDPNREVAARIVIADDAAALRTLLRMRLRKVEGAEVVAEAADGFAAVELCSLHQPDLVLLDLAMPALDGLQAAEQIRNSAAATRIWVLSGYPGEIMRERALSAGADAYYEKSSDLDEICRAVSEVVRSSTS